MQAHTFIWVAAWLLSPFALVNFGFGLALALLQLVFWLRGQRAYGALLLRLGRRAGTDRLVELGALAVAVGALIEVAAAALATPVTLWGLRVGVALSVAGLAVVGSALHPIELRERGIVVRGQLVRWAQVTGHAWQGRSPARLQLSYATLAGTARALTVEVADDTCAMAERLLRERTTDARALAPWP